MRSITQAVPAALTELLRGVPLSTGKVTFAWKAVVGPALERVTSVRLEGHLLLVDADSTQWAREIHRSSPLILRRLTTLLGDNVVNELAVRTRS